MNPQTLSRTLPLTFVEEGKKPPHPSYFLAEPHQVIYNMPFSRKIKESGCVVHSNITEDTFAYEHQEPRMVRFEAVKFGKKEISRREVSHYYENSRLRHPVFEEFLVFVREYRTCMNPYHQYLGLGSGTNFAGLTRDINKSWWQHFADSITKRIPRTENKSPCVEGVHRKLLKLTPHDHNTVWKDSQNIVFVAVHIEDKFFRFFSEMEITQREYLLLPKEEDVQELLVGHGGSDLKFRADSGCICVAPKTDYPYRKLKYFRPKFID